MIILNEVQLYAGDIERLSAPCFAEEAPVVAMSPGSNLDDPYVSLQYLEQLKLHRSAARANTMGGIPKEARKALNNPLETMAPLCNNRTGCSELSQTQQVSARPAVEMVIRLTEVTSGDKKCKALQPTQLSCGLF
jgi:hypothetical protein